MVGLTALYLPILLSAVFVFIASSLVHMVLPWHKSDYPRLPDEDKFIDAVRPLAVPPGDYMVPRCLDRNDMRSPAFLDKMKKGPVMVLTVMPNGAMSMGRNLSMWFVYLLVFGVFIAYVGGRTLPIGTAYLKVFRLVGATAFIGHVFALWPMSIWYRRAWSATIKATVDGLIYALLTAGTFGWLWPK